MRILLLMLLLLVIASPQCTVDRPFDVSISIIEKEVMGSYLEYKDTYGESWVEDCFYPDSTLMVWALLPHLSEREAEKVAELYFKGVPLNSLLSLVFIGGVRALRTAEPDTLGANNG